MAYQLDLRAGGELPEALFGHSVRELLGESTLGNVYRARAPAGINVALKHFKVKSDDDRSLEHLRNELRVSQAVTHLYVRRAIKLETARGEAGLVLDFFDGPCLEHQRALTEMSVIDAFLQVAHALDALHQKNLIHADLRPSNILLNAKGQTRLIDLGEACAIGSTPRRVHTDPDYVTQEQLDGKPLDARVDVYTFSACLYWALLRRAVPNFEKTPDRPPKNQIFEKGRHIRPVNEINPKLPAPLCEFIARGLEPDPAKRPSSMKVAIAILTHTKASMQRSK